ncbi:MAG: 23S rRNA (adenine(2503)-C(2))-methyltransferase @ tRNA (adenine(37)-C(2))-methyltransferase, partial [uncultured Phycisphaerae bacterium]
VPDEPEPIARAGDAAGRARHPRTPRGGRPRTHRRDVPSAAGAEVFRTDAARVRRRGGRVGLATVPGRADPAVGVRQAGRNAGRNDEPIQARPRPARPAGGVRPGDRRPQAGQRGRHPEVALGMGRGWKGRRGRDGDDPRRRPPDGVRQLAGRVPGRLHVLRQRAGRAEGEPVGRPDRRAVVPTERDAQAPGRAGDEHRVHGHGRAAGQLQQRHAGDPHPARPGLLQHRGAEDHDQHGRRPAADAGAGRRGAAAEPGDLAARPERAAPAAADPVGRALRARGHPGRRPVLLRPDRAGGDARVHPAGRRERPPGARAAARPAVPHAAGEREPDPVQRGRGPAVRPAQGPGRADVPGRAAGERGERPRAEEPGPGHRRGLRAAAPQARPAAGAAGAETGTPDRRGAAGTVRGARAQV